MSVQSATQWVHKLHDDAALRLKAHDAVTSEARQNLAKENGFTFTREELLKAIEQGEGILNDVDLDSVAGGGLVPHADGPPGSAENIATGTASCIGTVATAVSASAAAV